NPNYFSPPDNPDSFYYTIVDQPAVGTPAPIQVHVRVFVTPSDDPATANPDIFAINRTQYSAHPLDVLANDANVDTDESSVGVNGYVIVGVSPLQRINGGDPGHFGPWQPGDTILQYWPATDGMNYQANFTYTIQDPHGNKASAQVTIIGTDQVNQA